LPNRFSIRLRWSVKIGPRPLGYWLDQRPSQQYGILYDRLVNAIRAPHRDQQGFTGVERLCNVHIPTWLATHGISEAEISALRGSS
jgi:hypothetical protein